MRNMPLSCWLYDFAFFSREMSAFLPSPFYERAPETQVIVRGLKAKNNHSAGDLYGNNYDEVSRRKQRK